MSSLKERIERLEADLKAVPPRISVYHDLPFAILRYDPPEEWILRREARLLWNPALVIDMKSRGKFCGKFLARRPSGPTAIKTIGRSG